MAATAYAFVVSLMNTMDSIQIHPRLSTCFHNHHFQSLRIKLHSLLGFLENHSDDSDHLLSRIAVVAQNTEDLIEVEAADQIRDLSTSQKTQSFLLHLQSKMQEMDSIINEKEAVIKLKEEKRIEEIDDTIIFENALLQMKDLTHHIYCPNCKGKVQRVIIRKTSRMVGFDGYVEKLLDELTGYDSTRRILPIVGMGGVGKTTLATSVYKNLLTVERFVVRVWITVSQAFTVRDIFVQAFSCLAESSSESEGYTTTDDELGEKLHKTLYGRRYLIVLDDMWSVEAWERIKFYFPENNNGSRIVVTTRQQQLVDYFASSRSSVFVDFLDEKNSWELFCDKIFGHTEQGSCQCPPQLQQAGEKIVKRCKGLPLAITVIGGLLAKSPRTPQYWDKIAKDKSLLPYSSGSDEGMNQRLLSILYTSYKHLPVCFKSCFLYLGLFPEDHPIDASELVKFLVAEGFIKPNRKQSLEEVAESCIKELVDRNLLLVGNLGPYKNVETYQIHDLVREMCIRIAEKENFYCVQRDIGGTWELIVDERTASFYNQESLISTSELPISLYHPLRFNGANGAPFKSRLWRVRADPIDALCKEVNLRLIYDISHEDSRTFQPLSKLPSSTLPLFWSLQTIIIRLTRDVVAVPVEIWKMWQLRHIEISRMLLPDPCKDTNDVLHNLQTLKKIEDMSLSEELCKRIPNVKELEICSYVLKEQDADAVAVAGENLRFHVHNLNKLESLLCCSYIEDPLQNLKLPNSLKELSLGSCGVAWSDLEILIGVLPHLQILVLLLNAAVGAEWNVGAEVEFVSLKHLEMKALYDLTTWNAEASNFPVLETLTLFYLSNLEGIPPGIGEIPTLEKIHLYGCTESAINSAIQILEEQQSNGSEDLQVQLDFLDKNDAQMWREQIQDMGITSQNLHISGHH